MSQYESLLEGNQDFATGYFQENSEKMRDLVENGQHPGALLITCSDSRVCPNLMTGTGPGDLFVTRNIGNFVPPYSPEEHNATAAAIEYAVSALGVPNIIVCGHTHCGAMAALYAGAPGDDFVHVRKWLELGDEVKEKVFSELPADAGDEERCRLTEEMNVVTQMENLLTYPAVKQKVDEGSLKIHGWVYDIASGEIAVYDAQSNTFVKGGQP